MAELVEALHCKTVMSLIPEGVIGNFYLLNPLGQTMALGSTQPHYRNEYQEYLLVGKGTQCAGLTTLPPSYTDCVEILGASTSWNPKCLSRSGQDCVTVTLRLKFGPQCITFTQILHQQLNKYLSQLCQIRFCNEISRGLK